MIRTLRMLAIGICCTLVAVGCNGQTPETPKPRAPDKPLLDTPPFAPREEQLEPTLDAESIIIAQAPDPAPPATARGPKISEQELAAVGIRRLTSSHLTLYTDLPSAADVDELPKVFDLALPQWCKYFDVKPSTVKDFHVYARLMQERPRFVRVGLYPQDLPDFPHGYNRGTNVWLYEQPSVYYRRHLLLHEGTHAFMEAVLGGTGPPWYREGMAELLGTHAWQNGVLQLLQFPRDKSETPEWGRVKIIKDQVGAGRALKLVDIMRYDTRAHYRNEAYGWCWAITMFFESHPDTQMAFRDLRARARDRSQSFNRDFYTKLQAKWPHLEEQWKLFTGDIDYGYDIRRNIVVRKSTRRLDAGTVTATIKAARGWQSSGVEVEAGKTYQIDATGRFQIAHDGQPWPCEASGVTLEYYGGQPLGILLAGVSNEKQGNGELAPLLTPTVVGRSSTYKAKASGTLFFRVNDSPAKLADNNGELRVTIATK